LTSCDIWENVDHLGYLRLLTSWDIWENVHLLHGISEVVDLLGYLGNGHLLRYMRFFTSWDIWEVYNLLAFRRLLTS
jgi:hypothetical protein